MQKLSGIAVLLGLSCCLALPTVVRAECGGSVVESGTTITTPNYPEDYDTNSECQWAVDAGDPSLSIKISFVDFDLDNTDRMIVLNSEDEVVGNFTGFGIDPANAASSEDFPPVRFETAGGKLTITFTSDQDSVRRGFRMTVSWPECPKDSRCSQGVQMVTDSKECTQCVCKGCPPVECPIFCPFGETTFKRFGQDCQQCLCKAPTCEREGCETVLLEGAGGDSNNDYYCRCPEKRVGEIKFWRVSENYATFIMPTVNINGQDRMLCTSLERELFRGGFTELFCNQFGVVREDYIYGAGSFYDVEPLFGVRQSDIDHELVFPIKADCLFLNGSLDIRDYADCLEEKPIIVKDCVNREESKGVFAPWCLFPGAFFPDVTAEPDSSPAIERAAAPGGIRGDGGDILRVSAGLAFGEKKPAQG